MALSHVDIFFKSSWCKIACVARNLINYFPQAIAMIFAFSSTVYASSMACRKQPSWGFEFRKRVLKTIVNNQVCFSCPLLPSQCLHLDLRYFGTNTFCHGAHFVFIYLFFFYLAILFLSLVRFIGSIFLNHLGCLST